MNGRTETIQVYKHNDREKTQKGERNKTGSEENTEQKGPTLTE